jgi:hypothetical protein
MSFSFPLSPITNQTYTYSGTTWVYNGSAWSVQASSAGSLLSADGTSIINTSNVLSASSSNIKSVAAALLTNGTSTGITFSYNSGTGVLTSTVSGTQQQAGISGVTVQNTGVTQGSANAVTTLNFTGTGLTRAVVSGGVATITVDSSSYSLPIAGISSSGQLGGVKVDGTSITISNGVISTVNSYSLPTASTSVLGGVKIDGTTITINNGVIGALQYALPAATTSTLGGVKVDGTSITIVGGVISASGSGGSGNGLVSRTSASVNSITLPAGTSGTYTITGFKGYALYSIQTSSAAWVTIYNSAATMASDAGRSITTDPTPGTGVIAEAITTTGATQYFSPAIIGYSAETPTPTTAIPLRIYNNGSSSTIITVTLTFVQLEV